MKKLMIILVMLLFALPCCAQEEKKEISEQQVMQEASVDTALQREADIVKKALEVYKNKAKDDERETSVVIENADGSKTLIIGKSYSSSDNTLVFSPDGGRAFYMGTSTSGASVVYGVDFSTSQTYSFGGAVSFSLADCPNKESYVVITKDGEEEGIYYIYDYEGNSIDAVTYTGDIEDINEVICY